MHHSLIPLRHELRRVFKARKFWYLALITLLMVFYSYDPTGFQGTAPFSQPSVAFLLVMGSPVWAAVLTLLLQDVYNEKERAARNILRSAPVTTAQYLLPKIVARVAAWLLLIFVSLMILSIAFMLDFRDIPLAAFGMTLLLFTFPAILFTLGLTVSLGRINGNAVYAVLLLIFLIGLVNLQAPLWMDWFGNNLHINIEYIVSLWDYDGASLFATLPRPFLYGRIGFAMLGIALTCVGCTKRL